MKRLFILSLISIVCIFLFFWIEFIAPDSKPPDKRLMSQPEEINLVVKVALFREENGFLPTTSQGLDTLVVRPADHPHPDKWKQILKTVPIDP